MYSLIVLLPFLGAFTTLASGRWLGSKGAVCITTGCLTLSALLSWCAFYEVGICNSPCAVIWAPWVTCGLFDASWGMWVDSLTATMLVVITTVSALVHLYSSSYMSEDPHVPRFMAYLSIFTFFMLMLVTSDNMVQLFFGWEGVGLASYLLINFWFTRLQANKAAIKAMLVNRVGDIGLALGLFMCFAIWKSVNLAVINGCAHLFHDRTVFFGVAEFDIITVVGILLFIGAVGKSAQLGLHTWLPDAMEGPTPVSALIHAATMVTAGVFLLARMSPLLEHSPQALQVITIVGALTAFFAATTGVVQNDLKRVIAYSTCSQLGYMIFACGLSHYGVGIFHLMNHAFFKALLFLGAGSVIHALGDEQDMRKMGGLTHVLPMTYTMMGIGSMALVGFPFLTGFYSKEVILEVACAQCTITGCFAYWLGLVSAVCTSYYSFRLVVLTFFAKPSMHKMFLTNVHDAPLPMALPLMFLALGSIFVGYIAQDMMVGLGTPFWDGVIFGLPSHMVWLEAEHLPQHVKLLPLVGSIFGAYVSTVVYNMPYTRTTAQPVYTVYTFLNKRWFFDVVYNSYLNTPALKAGYTITLQNIDKGFLEVCGPTGIMRACSSLVLSMKKMYSGQLYHVALVMLAGVAFLVACVCFWDSMTLHLNLGFLCVLAAAWACIQMIEIKDVHSFYGETSEDE